MLTGKAMLVYYTFIFVRNSVTYISLEVGSREVFFFIVGRGAVLKIPHSHNTIN